MRFSLACYTIRLRRKGSRDFMQLDSFQGNEDLVNVFNQYLVQRTTAHSDDPDGQKLLHVTRSQQNSRVISGIVETGQYGYEAELHDVNTFTVSHVRTPNEAEMVPFYFLVSIPHNRDEGVLLLQRRAQFGIRTVFLKDFSEYFRNLYPEIIVEFNPLVTQELIDRYLNGGILKQLRLVRFAVGTDIASNVVGGHDEQSDQIELRISAKRNEALPYISRILDSIREGRPPDQLIELSEISDVDFDYDTVKVELEMNGTRRTVDLSDLSKLRAYYDITSDVEVGTNGHPVFESIHAIASDLLDDALAQLQRNGDGARG